jgi:hypothetical protein
MPSSGLLYWPCLERGVGARKGAAWWRLLCFLHQASRLKGDNMRHVLAFLWVATTGVLIFSLISPKRLSKLLRHDFSRWQLGLMFGALFFVFGAAYSNRQLSNVGTTATQVAQHPVAAATSTNSTPPTSPAKYVVYPQGASSPTSNATEWASDGAASVINPADLRIYGEVKNTGGKSDTPTCTIQAHDDTYSYHGTDAVERTSPLKPGGIWDWVDDVTITSQGAQYVTKIEVICQ